MKKCSYKHTKCPEGYIDWHNWAELKALTHTPIKCPICGLYEVWVKNEPPEDKK